MKEEKADIGEDIPCINEVMTKEEQAKALLAEDLQSKELHKGKKFHTAKQIRSSASDLSRFFKDLAKELETECGKMVEATIQKQKKKIASQFTDFQMQMIEFADFCRDNKCDDEYEKLVNSLGELQKVKIN